MIKYIPLALLFFVGLAYILAPSPNSIHDFPAIPYAIKSQLEGDTVQNPNNKAYFSDWTRSQITAFYQIYFNKANFFYGLRLPAIRLNYPPEDAYNYIRDQEQSTFLEEYLYPLRTSIFVNGFEPKIARKIPGKARYVPYDYLDYGGTHFASKTSLRYYNSSIIWRIIVYVGIWASFWGLYKLTKEAVAKA